MATFRKRLGKWRVEIARLGVRRSGTFDSKQAAIAWAARQEIEITAGVRGNIPNLTVNELLKRYETEVSPTKKGARWEIIRLRAWERDRLALVRLRQLDAPHVADWQRRRLQAVSSASVRRERNLLNNVFEIARKEWRWLGKNPFEGIRRPKDGKARRRLASDAEIDRLTTRASPALYRTIWFAIETGMRAGEIAGLTDVRGQVAYLADTKNGEAREVPLSSKAVEMWNSGSCSPKFGKVGLGLSAGSISALFARLCEEAGIKGLTFQDLRRTAIVRLSKKLGALELAKMVGHRDLKMTLNVYYKVDAADIAKRLD